MSLAIIPPAGSRSPIATILIPTARLEKLVDVSASVAPLVALGLAEAMGLTDANGDADAVAIVPFDICDLNLIIVSGVTVTV